MTNSTCEHCGNHCDLTDKNCRHCGIPLPPDFAQKSQKRFVYYFIALIIFCAVIIIWLPPDWSRFIK